MAPKKASKKASQPAQGALITRFFKPSQGSVSSGSSMTTRSSAALAASSSSSNNLKHTTAETTVKSHKRARTPDSRQSVEESYRTPVRPISRLADSTREEQENIAVAQALPTTPNPQFRKKARYSSPDPPVSEASITTIPSSQSNEEELTLSFPLPRSNFSLSTIPSTAEWAKTVLPPTPDHEDDDHSMLVDDAATLSSQTRSLSQMSSVTTKTNDTPIRHFSPVPNQAPTPPQSDLPSLPPTPVAMSSEQKTAQMIADVKARAYLAAAASPEPVTHAFKDELSDSSDEEDLTTAFAAVAKPAAKKIATQAAVPPARTSARLQAKKSPDSSPSEERRRSGGKARAAQSSPPRLSKNLNKRNAPQDPIQKLINAHQKANAEGSSADHIRRAEKIIEHLNSTHLLDENDEDDGAWLDFDQSATDLRTCLFPNGSTSDGNKLAASGSVESLDFTLDDEVKKELFDAGAAKAGLEILDNDRSARRRVKHEEVAIGIHFWMDSGADESAAINVDSSLRCVLPGTHTIIKRLNTAFERDDLRTAQLILESNLLPLLPSAERAPAVRGLFELALSPNVGALSAAAFRALDQYWRSSPEKLDDGLNFPAILSTFERSGASQAVLSSLKWKTIGLPTSSSDREIRAVVANRIASGLATCAEYNRLRDNEIANLIVCLLLIGSDRCTSQDVQHDVIVALDRVCDLAFSKDCALDKDSLCRSVMSLVTSVPDEKIRVHVLRFLSSCGKHGRLLAAAVAYNLLHNFPGKFRQRPVLLRLIDWLSSNSHTENPRRRFIIDQNTDYETVAADVALVGFVMLNIDEYLSYDEETRRTTPAGEKKPKEPLPTALQQMTLALDSLHNRITDGGAADLDRIRLKAQIKTLSMHIHYRREVYVRNQEWRRQKKQRSILSYAVKR